MRFAFRIFKYYFRFISIDFHPNLRFLRFNNQISLSYNIFSAKIKTLELELIHNDLHNFLPLLQ